MVTASVMKRLKCPRRQVCLHSDHVCIFPLHGDRTSTLTNVFNYPEFHRTIPLHDVQSFLCPPSISSNTRLSSVKKRNIFFFQVLSWDLQNKLLHFCVGWWWRSWSFCKDGSQWNWIWWYAGDFFAISLVEHISFRQPYNSFMLKALCFLFHVLGNLNIFLNEYVNCSSPG